MPEVVIRKPQPSDLPDYTKLLQRTYQAAYTDESIGLSSACFALEVFLTDDTQNYLKKKLIETDHQRVWLAQVGSDLIGSISIEDCGDFCEVSAFYVAPECQGQGIGRKLWQQAMDFAGDKEIKLELYTHNRRAIDIYRKWGFELDATKGEGGYFYRHWPEWPENVRAQECYLRRRGGFEGPKLP